MQQNNWSVPETEVVQRISEHIAGEKSDVLATIVDVEGNAYRRPGAKMLLDEGGSGVGSITAGCLEDELLSAAGSVRESGRPERVTYDLMNDDEDVWGLGVGCNGIIDVLLEPLDDTYRPAVEAFERGEDIAIVTALSGDGALTQGDRAYYYPENDRIRLPDGSDAEGWPDAIADPAAELARRGRSDTLTIGVEGTDVEFFIDGLAAPAELVVFGSGHDVAPVTELAERNDFRVTVVGFRGAVDLDEQFSAAHRTLTTSPGSIEDAIDIDDRTYAVVMTHNFIDDQLTVETLLNSPAPYVGLMGPHDRFEEMLEAYEDEGTTFQKDAFASLYTPIGLSLGGGTPYQIAHSIIAEVLAVQHDQEPVHLRDRDSHIHERVEVATDGGEGV
jgi:xanthine dehydrogenase accessory factor